MPVQLHLETSHMSYSQRMQTNEDKAPIKRGRDTHVPWKPFKPCRAFILASSRILVLPPSHFRIASEVFHPTPKPVSCKNTDIFSIGVTSQTVLICNTNRITLTWTGYIHKSSTRRRLSAGLATATHRMCSGHHASLTRQWKTRIYQQSAIHINSQA